MPSERQHRQTLARAINSALGGQIDCTMPVTLATGATSTVIQDARISLLTAALFAPQTAHAAAELASGGMYWVCSKGQCVITHSNAMIADRTYTVALLG
jgi:hypothetical protein